MGYKRRDVPQYASTGLQGGINAIELAIEDDYCADFSLAVVQTILCGISELCLKVSQCDQMSATNRICALVAKHHRSSSGGDIVCLSSDKLNLKCPITLERLKEPVRGIHCQHLQCFDLDAYLTINRQVDAFNNRWQCPVCTLILRPADLSFDPYVEEVLASTCADVGEVVVAIDGSWSVGRSSGYAASSHSSLDYAVSSRTKSSRTKDTHAWQLC